jgi:hypothetical protein
MWYVTLPLVVLLFFLMYYGYCVVTNTRPFWEKVETDNNGGEDERDSPLGYCTFEGEDLYNNRVYTLNGVRVSTKTSPIKCGDCSKYLYKNKEGCAPFMFDTLINSDINDSASFDNFCDPAHPERDKDCVEPHGVCTVGLSPSKKCPF